MKKYFTVLAAAKLSTVKYVFFAYCVKMYAKEASCLVKFGGSGFTAPPPGGWRWR